MFADIWLYEKANQEINKKYCSTKFNLNTVINQTFTSVLGTCFTRLGCCAYVLIGAQITSSSLDVPASDLLRTTIYTAQNLLRITFFYSVLLCVFVINMKIDLKELNIFYASCTWQIDNLSTQ